MVPAASLRAETLTALGAPRVQHLPATLGRHARPEPVGTLTADFARLIGSFGHDCWSNTDRPDGEAPGKGAILDVSRAVLSTLARFVLARTLVWMTVDNSTPAV